MRHGFTPRASQEELLFNRASAGLTQLAQTHFWNAALSLNVFYFLGEISSYWGQSADKAADDSLDL